jgi:PhoPQ-activated pathogenicity-related protein
MKLNFLKALWAGCLILLCHPSVSAPIEGALKAYVNAEDAAYAYRWVGSEHRKYVDYYFLDLDSQQWRTPEEVAPTLWNHWVTLIVPHNTRYNTANLILQGGVTSNTPPDVRAFSEYETIARLTGSIQVVLQQVPVQQLVFSGREGALSENDLVAYSWRKVMETGDPTWSVYLPMTKAAVRSMDCAQAFSLEVLKRNIDSFMVTGFSKRGAIAWLTAAVDPRVTAVVPGDYNVLFLDQQLEHHFNSYGFYAEALSSYLKQDIPERIRSPEGQMLKQLVDPISYQTALTMPHYILNATGDEFFLPDASEEYIHQIPGEVLQRLVPNTNHTFEGKRPEILQGLIAWYQLQLEHAPRPVISWQIDQYGVLEVSSDQKPMVAKLWQAFNPEARDFRYPVLGKAWKSRVITPDREGVYRVRLEVPEQGYNAFLVELTLPGMAGQPQVYTTSVFITPDDEPFEVESPLNHPRTLSYWQKQLEYAQRGRAVDYEKSDFQKMLPIRVLGNYIEDLDTLSTALNHPGAGAQCTAARLNVQAEELGWYTTLFVSDGENIKYWQSYDLAEQYYTEGADGAASLICRLLSEYRQ